MKIDSGWFRELIRVSPYRSQRQLAKKMRNTMGKPMDPVTLSLMLTGKRAMQIDEASQIAELLGVPLAEVLKRAGAKGAEKPARRLHISGYLSAGGEVRLEDANRGVEGPVDVPEDAIVIQTRGMRDPSVEGWVLFAARPAPFRAKFFGRLCVVELKSGRRGVGFLVSEPSRRVGLRPFLAQFEPWSDIKLKWIAPVLWVRAKT